MSHPPPEDEGAAATMCDELIATPFPVPLCSSGEVENMGVKLSPGRMDGWGKGVLRFDFSLSCSDLIGAKLN